MPVIFQRTAKFIILFLIHNSLFSIHNSSFVLTQRPRNLPRANHIIAELLYCEIVPELPRAGPQQLHQLDLSHNHKHVVPDTTQCRLEFKEQVVASVEQLPVGCRIYTVVPGSILYKLSETSL